MPRSGGEADKLGNRYEGLWTVDAALDLIDGEYVDLTVEAVGDEAAGVEFARTNRSGVVEYHSIKRQQGKGNWTLGRLAESGPTGRSILGDLIAKVDAGSEGVFSSGTSASELAELIAQARATESYDEFDARTRQNAKRSGQFWKCVVPTLGSEHGAWSALRRLRVRTVDEATLTTDVERRVRALLRTADGQRVDPKAARLLISDFLHDNLGRRLTGESILDDIEAHGLVRSRLVGDATVRQQIQRRNRAHAEEVRSRLINHEEIIRAETALASAALLDQGKSVVLEGAAGSGKSCVLVQLMRHLEIRDVPHLVIRLDTLESGDQYAQAIGTRLGLPDSPTITLGEFAGDQPSVLVVDQLDAISVVSARNQAVWSAFNELLDEARTTYLNMRIVFACRTFDLDRDPRLRGLAEDHERVERIPVGPLGEQVIRSAIAAAGLESASPNRKQLEILSTPLHLRLLLESPNPQNMEFTSVGDLYDAFWDHKAAAVSRRLRGNLSVWSDAVGHLSDELSRRESLIAPSLVLDEYGGALNVLASEGVVYVQNDNVGFFHESFFDYAFARAFVRSGKDIVKWLLDDEQHLFRRSQVRQVLEFLRGRESDRGTYINALRGLLSHPEIRFHIKKLVLDWLGALSDPAPDEWRVVEGLAEELGDHAWAVARNSVPWFDALHAMGRWEEWLRADDEQINRALGLLRMLDARSAAVAELVRGFRGASDDWGRRLRWLIEGRQGRTSSEIQDLIVELTRDGTLDDARPGIAVNDDWWFVWYGLGTEQPEFAIRLLGAWFDRQLARAAALGKDDPFEYGLGLVTHSQSSGDLIRECAAIAPIEFIEALFPRLARFHSSVRKDRIVAPRPRQWGAPDDQLRDALLSAMCTVAREDPASLDSLIEAEPLEDGKWMSALLLRAWSANPERYAERIVRFLLDSPGRRLNIAYSVAASGTDTLAAISRTAIAAASSQCSDESFAGLESAILTFTPDWERQGRFVGLTALALLRALDEHRLSESTRRRIEELERRHPDAPERGAPRPPSPEDFAAQWVGPPVSPTAQRRMTDAQWLAAMTRYRNEREDATPGGQIVGGANELSRGLEQLVREDPGRFAQLPEQMDGSQNPAYFVAILRGLTGPLGAGRPGTWEQICSVLRRIADIAVAGIEDTLADAIGALADEEIPDDIIRMLCEIAESAADPQQDDWLSRENGNRELAPIDQAINSARGRAAQSLATLLFADRDRWPTLKPTVDKLIVDPVLAVRSVAVECLLAVLDTHRAEALFGFERLIDGAEPILGSDLVERFVGFAKYRDYVAIRPTLVKMLASSESAALKAGARQMTLASLSLEEAREDADLVLSLGGEARVAAAIVYADNVADPAIGAECEERLRTLFTDESEAVRHAAARCWNALKPDELTERSSLLRAYVQSIGPDADVTVLTHALEQSHESLPPEVCDLAERAVVSYGRKAGDIRLREAAAAYDLAPLVMRLHEETDDPDLRRRVLDVIDDMLGFGFLGMNDRLGQEYDR